MLLEKALRYFEGSVSFTAVGGSPEKLLTLAARGRVPLWDIKPCLCGFSAGARLRDYAKLEKLASRSCTALTLKGKYGLPAAAARLAGHGGLLAGAALFISLIWFFSGFIWSVDISGNSSVPTARISQVLSSLGLFPGTFPLRTDTAKIEREALIELPELAWISINIDGTRAEVTVRERRYPPDVVPEYMPCNVRALAAGKIVRLEVYEGKAVLRAGDTVEKGGLIISGVVTDKNGSVMLMHASGRAVAQTRPELSVTVPYSQTVSADAGPGERRDTLRVFGLELPLCFGVPAGAHRITLSRSMLRIAGLTLPIGVVRRDYIPVKDTVVRRTPAQAEQTAAARLSMEEKTGLAGMKVTGRTLTAEKGGDALTLTGHYSCEENIAVEEEIALTY